MGAPVRYRSFAYDSSRWAGFELRRGDIVISTPPKCGTTWTQMICALLILQQTELPKPLSRLSPWLDMVTRSRREVFADLAGQQHRRFIKTHTPLDGIPISAEVTYICVGRDPRDVAISMGHHRDNLDTEGLLERRAAAAADDGVEPSPLPAAKPLPDDARARFWQWVDDDTPVTESGSTLRYTMHHLRSFWDARAEIDLVLLHYDDLTDHLDDEMRRLADRLAISVPDDRWPALAHAASFGAMRSQAALTAPGAELDQWRDATDFFHRGTSGQWRDLLDDVDLARYAETVRPQGPPGLVAWLHRPPLP